MDAGAAVERRVLAIPADRSYLTVKLGQTAESYVAGLRQKYIAALALAGLKAMEELSKLEEERGTPGDAPVGIIAPAIVATFVSTAVAVVYCKVMDGKK